MYTYKRKIPQRRPYTKGLNKYQRKQVVRIANANVEYKIKNVTFSSDIDNAGGVAELIGSNVAAGTGDSNRIGDKISLSRVYLNISFRIPNGGDHTNVIRCILFQWKNPTTPTVSSILSTTNDYNSVYDHDGRQNYKILYDKHIDLSYYGPAQKSYQIKIKNLARTVTYLSSTAQKNAVYILLISDSGAVLNPNVDYNCRSYYTDQ